MHGTVAPRLVVGCNAALRHSATDSYSLRKRQWLGFYLNTHSTKGLHIFCPFLHVIQLYICIHLIDITDHRTGLLCQLCSCEIFVVVARRQFARLKSIDGLVLSRSANVGCAKDTPPCHLVRLSHIQPLATCHLVKGNPLLRVGHHRCV